MCFFAFRVMFFHVFSGSRLANKKDAGSSALFGTERFLKSVFFSEFKS